MTQTLQYSIVGGDNESFVTVFIPGADAPLVAGSDHPNFEKIVLGAIAGDLDVARLFDVAESVSHKFEALSERVSIANGRVYLDGDEVNDALTKQIVRFLEADVEDWASLVAFMEKVASNPDDHSRTQLYEWLDRRDFTITESGDLVGYKGVQTNGDGIFRSLSSGTAWVNGEKQTGRIEQEIGDVVTMPRSEVQSDPSVGCHKGLHVGTYEYALGYANNGALLEVHVNPRDVVSVPTDCDAAKVRCCRYVIVDTLVERYTSPVLYGGRDEDEEDDFSELDEPEPERYKDNAGVEWVVIEDRDVTVGDRWLDPYDGGTVIKAGACYALDPGEYKLAPYCELEDGACSVWLRNPSLPVHQNGRPRYIIR